MFYIGSQMGQTYADATEYRSTTLQKALLKEKYCRLQICGFEGLEETGVVI
jgi:hypothetical protein